VLDMSLEHVVTAAVALLLGLVDVCTTPCGNQDVVHQAKPPPFLCKLLQILADPDCSDFVSWTDDGKGIVLKQVWQHCFLRYAAWGDVTSSHRHPDGQVLEHGAPSFLQALQFYVLLATNEHVQLLHVGTGTRPITHILSHRERRGSRADRDALCDCAAFPHPIRRNAASGVCFPTRYSRVTTWRVHSESSAKGGPQLDTPWERSASGSGTAPTCPALVVVVVVHLPPSPVRLWSA